MSHQQRVPADSSQGLSPAPCLSAAQKYWSELFSTIVVVFLSSGGQSSLWAFVGSRRTLLQEPKKQES